MCCELNSMSELSGFVYIKSHVILHVKSKAQKVNWRTLTLKITTLAKWKVWFSESCFIYIFQHIQFFSWSTQHPQETFHYYHRYFYQTTQCFRLLQCWLQGLGKDYVLLCACLGSSKSRWVGLQKSLSEELKWLSSIQFYSDCYWWIPEQFAQQQREGGKPGELRKCKQWLTQLLLLFYRRYWRCFPLNAGHEYCFAWCW